MEENNYTAKKMKYKIDSYPSDGDIISSLKEMNIDVATKVMKWRYDKELDEYYVVQGGKRRKVCDVNEFDPVCYVTDAMEVLEIFERKYNIRIETVGDMSLLWLCELTYYDEHKDESVTYKGEHESCSFAISEALLSMAQNS